LEPRLKVLPIGIEEHQLGHAEPLVEVLLGARVLPPGLAGGDLEDQGRNGLLPEEVDVPVVLAHAAGEQDVGSHRLLRLALLVVEEEVAAHPHVHRGGVEPLQSSDHIGHHHAVKRRLGHGLAVGGGVLDLLLERHRAHTCLPS
jgi:hypothetical protein